MARKTYKLRISYPKDWRVNYNGIQSPEIAELENNLDNILDYSEGRWRIIFYDCFIIFFALVLLRGLQSIFIFIAIVAMRLIITKTIMKSKCFYWEGLKYLFYEIKWIILIKNNRNDVRDKKEWDRVRKSILKRDNYQCQNQNCRKKGVPLDVHHICEVEYGGANDPRNLISLCRDCHALLHPWIKKGKRYRRRPKFVYS